MCQICNGHGINIKDFMDAHESSEWMRMTIADLTHHCPIWCSALLVTVLCVWWLWHWENMKPSLKGKHETQHGRMSKNHVKTRVKFTCRICCLLVSCHTWCVAVKSFSEIWHVDMNVASMTASRVSYWRWPSSWCWAETHSWWENMKPAWDRKTWNPWRISRIDHRPSLPKTLWGQ